ncbi:type VII secretion target [Saccharopolyspora griseoalba]|uniref:Type VII secretion target n=1 Tax=Saccharopolyspora griseoalba TaxID=1431848 RepID=A0ABW2LRB0_9PSEU
MSVTPQALSSHANYLSDLAGKISDAAEKGDGVSFGADSFGLVGQMFASQARETSEQAVQQLQTFSERTDKLRQAVSDCADAYTAEDDNQAACLAKIEW